MGDLVTLAEFIPQKAVSLVECMDEFEIAQLLAREKGLKTGDFIDYSQNKEKGNPSIYQLSNLISDCKTTQEILELEDKFRLVKKQSEQKEEENYKILQKKYQNNNFEKIKENLLIRKKELLERKNIILKSDYNRKECINTDYKLEKCLEFLKEDGLMDKLLESDREIKEDELQYNSNIHGKSHTRRVNFFATLIMESEKPKIINEAEERVIRCIIKNHDIGRTNDYEDKKHGENSVQILRENPQRMDGLTLEKKEIVEFIIKEHCLSNKENENDLKLLTNEKTQKYINERKESFKNMPSFMKKYMEEPSQIRIPLAFIKEENTIKRILDICKDADKLDRVRLDPRGVYPREGLDVSRLSLLNSQRLENIAYESLDKITDILDIEEEIQDIDNEIKFIDEYVDLKNELELNDTFEERLSEQKENIDKEKTKFLKSITKGKRFSKVFEIPKKIKDYINTKKESIREDAEK